jgi:hypothetical protein
LTREQREERRREREEALKRAAEERRQKEKAEEKEKWWTYAEMQTGKRRVQESKDDEVSTDTSAQKSKRKTAGTGMNSPQCDGFYCNYCTTDYALWDKWVKAPDDPASREEEEEQRKKLDSARDEEFEKFNPDFCRQVG